MARIKSVERIRGLAMLGVIGIHTGAWSLSNPHTNIHLFALLEIVSRFSVPIFFFISAFGLFYRAERQSGCTRLGLVSIGRLRSVVLPYFLWSLLYMTSYSVTYQDNTIWQAPKLWEFLLFGLASYQLYFLVILIMFLLCMPLLEPLAIWLAARPQSRLTGLLLLQILFNSLSSYLPGTALDNYWLNLLLKHRLNYLPLHYLWIFMFGAVFAMHYDEWLGALRERLVVARFWFAATLTAMLAAYYFVVLWQGYSLQQAAFTIHQLSPLGVLYTGAVALLLVQELEELPPWLGWGLDILARHSFFIYLVHPFVMSALGQKIVALQLIMTARTTIIFFVLTTGISLALSWMAEQLCRQLPTISLCLTGKTVRRQIHG